MKKNNINLLILNTLILIPTTYLVIHGFLYGTTNAQPGTEIIGIGYFKPYTMDSNVLALISSFFVTIFTIKKLITNKEIPKWVRILHLMSTTCLTLTFLVTLLFLSPMHGLFKMFEGELLFLHLLNPILSFISLIILSKEYTYKSKDVLLGTLPTLLYSVIYFLMVIVFKKWDDFYNFTFDGHYYLAPFIFIFMNFISYIISLLLTKIRKK